MSFGRDLRSRPEPALCHPGCIPVSGCRRARGVGLPKVYIYKKFPGTGSLEHQKETVLISSIQGHVLRSEGRFDSDTALALFGPAACHKQQSLPRQQPLGPSRAATTVARPWARMSQSGDFSGHLCDSATMGSCSTVSFSRGRRMVIMSW